MPHDETPFARWLSPRVNDNPLQLPGTDTCLKSVVIGGPEEPGDRRLFLDVELLGHLMAMARVSGTRRVEVPRVGVRVDLYQQPNGHRYEVWKFIGANPRPEPLPPVVSSLVRQDGH